VALVRKALSESRDEVDQLSQLLKTALTGKAALEDKVGPPPSTLHPPPCTLHPAPYSHPYWQGRPRSEVSVGFYLRQLPHARLLLYLGASCAALAHCRPSVPCSVSGHAGGRA
jgi:hypothetical protein